MIFCSNCGTDLNFDHCFCAKCVCPNAVWHADGYDKLKPYGFPIHGAIDGFSRRVLWLDVTRSNNNSDMHA